MDVILLYFGHQHVSATHVAIFRWFLWEQEYSHDWNVTEPPHSVKNHIISC